MLVNRLIRPIDRIGELAVYDTALRIGARFDLEPEKVYVHSTRDGIRKLDSDLANRQTIQMEELPAPIRKLKPREAEDFLCVYKGDLGTTLRESPGAVSRRRRASGC